MDLKFYKFPATAYASYGDGGDVEVDVALTPEEAQRIVDYLVQEGPDYAEFEDATELEDIYERAQEEAKSEVDSLMDEWSTDPEGDADYECSVTVYFPEELVEKAREIVGDDDEEEEEEDEEE